MTQSRMEVKSNAGAPSRVATMVFKQKRGVSMLKGMNFLDVLAQCRSLENLIEETWCGQGDCYDLIEGSAVILWPPENLEFRQCTLKTHSKTNILVLHDDDNRCWIILVLPSDDSGTDGPADFTVDIGTREPDPEEEAQDPPSAN